MCFNISGVTQRLIEHGIIFREKTVDLLSPLKKCFIGHHLPPGHHRHRHQFSKNAASYKCLFALAFF